MSKTSENLLKLGIVGARNTGKTCLLSCLYGSRSSEEGAVLFGEDATIDLLQKAWELLKSGELPEANALIVPDQVQFSFSSKEGIYRFQTYDYAGALVQRKPSEGAAELADSVRAYLRSCQGLLFLIDVGEDDLEERMNELDLILSELQQLRKEGQRITRPLGVVLTKWDLVGPIERSLEVQKERAKEYLQRRVGLKKIWDTLEHFGDRVDIFPVSAFGDHRERHLPPAEGPKPFGLLAPLIWVGGKMHEVLFEKADREAKACASRKLWNNYGKAIQGYENLRNQYGINHGPVKDRIDKRLETYRRKRQRKCFRGIIAASLVLWVMLIGSAWIGHVKLQSEFKELSTFRNQFSHPERAWERLERAVEYLKKWYVFLAPNYERTRVKQWKAEDQKARARYNAKRAYHDAQAKVTGFRKDKKYADAIQEWERFLRDHPDSDFDAEVQRRVELLHKSQDDAGWDEVRNYERKNPKKFEQIIEKATAYKNKPDAHHREEAEKLIEKAETRWDKREYEDFRRTAIESAKSTTQLANANEKAKEYLDGSFRKNERSKKAVQEWHDWFEGLKKNKDYYITVVSLVIPSDSDLAESTGDEETRVKVKLGATGHWTHPDKLPWPKGRNPQIGKKLGPFTAKWGEKQTLEVEAEEYDLLDPNDKAAHGQSDPKFVLFKANGPFIIFCEDRKEVKVYLECKDVIPPELPPYPTQ